MLQIMCVSCTTRYRVVNEISPYEQVFKRKPDLSRFRVWGCKCYFHLNDRDKLLLESTKLDGTAVRAVHLGYDEQRLRAYHVYVFTNANVRGRPA